MAIEITAAVFFNALIRWRFWVEESLVQSRKSLEIARSKPEGAEHDGNLYMAEDGSVWAQYGDMWHELTRKGSEPYAEYKRIPRFKGVRETIADGSVQSVERPDGTKLVFVKRSWIENTAEDWGWQIKSLGSWPPSHPAARYYERSIQIDECGLQLAKVLLEKRKEIEVWMEAYANSQGELRATNFTILPCDWDSMLERFAPGLKGLYMPCLDSLGVKLNIILDQIALGRQVRLYAF